MLGLLKDELVGAAALYQVGLDARGLLVAAILVLDIGGRVAAGSTQDHGGAIEALGHQEDIGQVDGPGCVVVAGCRGRGLRVIVAGDAEVHAGARDVQVFGLDDQVAGGDIDIPGLVIVQLLGDIFVKGEDAGPADGCRVQGEGAVLALARTTCQQWLLLHARGVLGMLRRGSSVSGGVGNRGDAAPAAQHEAGEQQRDKHVAQREWNGERETNVEGRK